MIVETINLTKRYGALTASLPPLQGGGWGRLHA